MWTRLIPSWWARRTARKFGHRVADYEYRGMFAAAACERRDWHTRYLAENNLRILRAYDKGATQGYEGRKK